MAFGDQRQSSSKFQMIFQVPVHMEHMSWWSTLEPTVELNVLKGLTTYISKVEATRIHDTANLRKPASVLSIE